MARVDVIMPQMGESIAEGTVSRWLKKVGDSVKRDEPIFEISTDKVDAEIPSPSAGVLMEILVGEGMTVAVNTVVARLETDAAAAAAAPAPSAPVPAETATAIAATSVATPAPVAASAAPPAARPAVPATEPGSLEERLRTKSSPLVRKIAAEHGVEIASLSGTGIAGRVTRRDLDAFLANRPAAAAAAPAGVSMYAPAGTDTHGPLPTPWPGDVVEPMSKIRKLTSDHMATARRVAAHVTTFWEIDLTRVARLRNAMRRDFEAQSGQKLTYMPFILQAVSAQLKRHPVLNAAVAGNDIIYRKQVNLGVAVALEPTGLIVPVLKRADELSLTGLTRGVNDLAARARGKKLSPADVQDATFTITNPGTFGSITGTPIIPVGTTAILCLGAIEKRPKVVTGPDGEDTIAIRTCCYFSLSFDHKVVDGADADRFMGDLKKALESVSESTV
ncbi:dihydrolipoamide acetyltransferase family protein [Gemmatimonas sp.]|uniref:dihydrolipoamide acetyltransferase family protein n=2 Tax=Gemmatimonas sp. TaxID=1962908 RepID=UPI0022BBA125|nr:dihydrolipoamide acetyltransferase family protein [Gemmatimonas sp.]MCE2954071.1 2-oxo acid dehydrogenase subunit E2 [Gemmatimonas sp.]MCZ8013389.1 dihydrolipoamide acetyltransferase family protein [Gemmatimonas sp.]MCZ8268629.1 dihydrolipoamide acetyltransferase family protein [Gemmatimonas sp.]